MYCCFFPHAPRPDPPERQLTPIVRPPQEDKSGKQQRANSAPVSKDRAQSGALRKRLARSLDMFGPRDAKPEAICPTRAQHLQDMFQIEQDILSFGE